MPSDGAEDGGDEERQNPGEEMAVACAGGLDEGPLQQCEETRELSLEPRNHIEGDLLQQGDSARGDANRVMKGGGKPGDEGHEQVENGCDQRKQQQSFGRTPGIGVAGSVKVSRYA